MIAIIDYGLGNTGSVRAALARLGHDSVITDKAEDISAATHLIMPGVGSFADGMREIRERGLEPILRREVLENKKPLLGICLGMQLLGTRGEEGGGTEGLGFVPGPVRLLRADQSAYRLPHVGWNDVVVAGDDPLFAGISSCVFYFVHSYVLEPEHAADIAATCNYGGEFAAAVRRGNVYGVQFHPEKSQKSGLMLLKNFIDHA